MLKVCATKGCPELTSETRCPTCTSQRRREQDRRRPSSSRRGYDAAWRQTRARYLSAFPICQHQDGCLEPATDVDHIDGLGPHGPRGHDFGNLRGYCHSHHSQRTARDQAGGWNA